MKPFGSIIATIFSDLAVNLAAGYFGAAFITPGFSRKKLPQRLLLLTTFITNGTMWMVIAFVLRMLI